MQTELPATPSELHHQRLAIPTFPMDQSHIDDLLGRHLLLLDEYTRLRDRLSKLQSSVYYLLARANFETQRGFRYGSDQYDARMKAVRRLRIDEDAEKGMTWKMTDATGETEPTEEEETRKEANNQDDTLAEELEEKLDLAKDTSAVEDEEKLPKPGQKQKTADPLRWFGLMPPASLRNAQTASIESVQEVIPRLVEVNVQMQQLEIEIRRARKRRAKADEKKSKVEGTEGSAVPASA
jgi:coiled-coil domain-containing protein 115